MLESLKPERNAVRRVAWLRIFLVATTLGAAITGIVVTWKSVSCDAHRKACQASEATHQTYAPLPPSAIEESEPGQAESKRQGECTESYLCTVVTAVNLPNLYLAIAGVWGIVIAIGTLYILGQQAQSMRYQTTHLKNAADQAGEAAKAAKDNAEAALLSAKAVINSERAWIDGQIIPETKLDVTRYRLTIINHGRTPAHLFNYKVSHGRMKIDGAEFSPERLPASQTRNLYILIPAGGVHPLEPLDIKKMLANDSGELGADLTGHIYVKIEYADLVSDRDKPPVVHETSFVYEYNFLLETLERISWYNNYT
ncbi:MAG TPA: hypothetical protein VIH72_00655 [Candidatus Acidoferrales bacterium]